MGHLDGDVRPVSQPPVWCRPPGPGKEGGTQFACCNQLHDH